MQISVYKTSGGKDIISGGNYSPEGKAKILRILKTIKSDGIDRFITRFVNKNSTPKLLEIKRDRVRVFFFKIHEEMYITHIVENKQKNKTELTDKELATNRIEHMINNPDQHVRRL